MAKTGKQPEKAASTEATAREKKILVRLYNQQPVPVDMLHYTAEFEEIYGAFRQHFPNTKATRHHVMTWLVAWRKEGGELAKKGRKYLTPTPIY
jgi:hypothetical protein